MRTFKIIILFLLVLYSCDNKKNHDLFNPKVVDRLKDGNFEIPSKYGYIPLYIATDNNKIVKTNSDYLNYIYSKHYRGIYKEFDSFLSDILNGRRKLTISDFKNTHYESFMVEKEIEREYKHLGFKNFYNKFTETHENKTILKKMFQVSREKSLTISFYFYINKYYVIKNDLKAENLVVSEDSLFELHPQ